MPTIRIDGTDYQIAGPAMEVIHAAALREKSLGTRIAELEASAESAGIERVNTEGQISALGSALAERDGTILALREALSELVSRRERACEEVGGNPDGSDGRYSRARNALASTAQAAQDAERRIRMDEREKIKSVIVGDHWLVQDSWGCVIEALNT
jgi:chromosome segregation ATPase